MNPLYIIIGVIVLALIVLTVIYFLQQRKKKREAALAAEMEEPVQPDDEVAVLVRDAESKLAAAKIEGAKAAHLPVYLLLGDVGSAKTSVMLQSGLDPELVAGGVYQQGNVAPTRSANIWYTRRSLFVEAGGKLIAEPPKWKKLIQKLQPKASVMGKGEQAPRAAIVFFNCENFTQQAPMEIAAAQARALRARLGEVCQTFGIKLPVYAVFTKMDRLPFFTEYVRNLSNEEASQVLGATLPMTGARPEGVYAEEETSRLTGSFEALFRSLADARIEFLPRETDPNKLPPEYEFPREFRKIRQILIQFLVDLCRPSQLATGPFLRGFYFSGVRPIIINETAPVQAAAAQQNFGGASGATGIFSMGAARQAAQQQQPVVTGARKVPQWLFLGHFFTDVLFADRSAMGASGSSTKTSGARRWLLGFAAGLALLLLLFFTISFFNNRGLENQVTDASRAIGSGEAVGADFASVDSLRKLDDLRRSVETLSRYHREGAPFLYRWFLYIGDDLYPEARKLYFARFKQLLFGQTQANDVAFLQSLPSTPGKPDYNPTYDALKAYLITTSNHDKSTKLFLAPELMDLWQLTHKADTDRQQLARTQFDFYSEELKDSNPFSSENDSAAVERARHYLAMFGNTQRVYAYMLSEAARANPAINFNKQFPGSAAVLFEPREVSGAFSKGGWTWMKDALGHIDRYFGGDKWVLGDYASANIDRAKLEDDIKNLYYGDFVKEWTAYIKSAQVVKYSGLKDASTKLQQLSGNQSPILELMALASNNTDVDEPTVKNVFQPVQTVVPPGSMDKFVASSNQNYMNALIALQSSIESISDLPGQPTDVQSQPALQNAQQAQVTTRQLNQTFRPDPVNHVDAGTLKILEDPILYVLGLIRLLGPAELNGKGKDLCAQEKPIMAKYPFNPNPNAPAATKEDFNTILQPQKGLLWVFYNTNLQKLLQKQGSTFVPLTSGMTVNPSFLNMLNRAAAFTDVAYANGATDPAFTYTVKPVWSADEDSLRMIVDGQTVEFTQANQAPKQLNWPGTGKGVQTSVSFKGQSNQYPTYDGLWGIFQFVQDADKHTGNLVEMILKSGKSGKTVNDLTTGQPITLRFEITANPPVFDKGYFQSMACVAEVVKP